uniref:NADH-ubiquinone oxidoreductase chain 5 n=1 Tax=Pielomastax zhengi TaxID=997267 RepID=G8DZA0_9ORTH|nr:NADH dehydrogenase subunit 5 [Pielomastax zhengi]ADZ62109.1 NADH dehydrogenase subunit 5 [Pielomastax zhengi]
MSLYSLMFLFLFLIGLLNMMMGLNMMVSDLVYFIDWEIFTLNSCSFVMTFLFDWMSFIFMSFVIMISSMVMCYSLDYMSDDYNINRFFMLVFLFICSMLMMILSPNLISILLGWDGLGLVSYCLVIYYQNVKSYNAGMLTALSNRVGDIAILLSISWMLNFGSWNYIYYLYSFDYLVETKFIMYMLIIAAMTSSAQIPFSSWLPSAMAAPTPVSALVHSSTLVTAGVYLMIRFNYLLMSTGFSTFLLIIGGLTMLMAGLGANYEYDLKSIIALSTLSQLGLMMGILSMGYYKLAFFHLLTHALFKALLFLCAGSYIHSLNNYQDIRYMGSMIHFKPLTSVCLNLSSLSLCGMPFLAGFYSSDLILELLMMSHLNILMLFIYLFATGLTSMYSFRLYYYSLTSETSYLSFTMFNEDSTFMNLGMVSLTLIAVFGGSMLSWLLMPFPYLIILPSSMKLMTILLVFTGGYAGYFIFSYNNLFLMVDKYTVFCSSFLGSMLFMPFLSTSFLSYLPMSYGLRLLSSMDQGWSEMLGGQGLNNFYIYFLHYMQWFYDSSFKIYLLLFMFWMLILFGLFFILY